MKKIILSVVLLIVLAMVSAGIWGYFAFLYTKPLNKAELAELTPDWSVVTHNNWSPWFDPGDGTKEWNPAASFNAWLATVPEEEKAWPILVELKYAYSDLIEDDASGAFPEEGEDWIRLINSINSAENVGVIEQIQKAYSKPVMGCGLYFTTDPYEHDAMMRHGVEDDDWDPNFSLDLDLLNVLIPALRLHMRTSKILSSYSPHLLLEGDTDGCIDLIESIMDSSELSLEFPVLIGQLVSAAIKSNGQSVIVWALENHSDQFTDEQLERLDQILERHQQIDASWQGEALWFHDILRRVSSADGKLLFSKANRWGSAFAEGDAFTDLPTHVPDAQLHASLQRPMYLYGKALSLMEAQCALPWDDSLISSYEYLESNFGSVNYATELIINLMMPATGKFAARVRQYEQVAIANRLLITVYRHRLEHGAFPESFEQIDERFLTFEPIDAFNGQRLSYILTEYGPVIYSVGDNRVDDQGEPMWKVAKENTLRVPDWHSSSEAESLLDPDRPLIGGDWVLYPKPNDD